MRKIWVWLLGVIGVIVLGLAIIWLAAFVKCEVLTNRYGSEFAEAYRENTMLCEPEYWKVLEYSEDFARVYYVGEDRCYGNILTFKKVNGEWKYDTWEATVWSKTGSADGFVWPYIR